MRLQIVFNTGLLSNRNEQNTLFIYFFYLFIYLFIHLFIYLFIYLVLISSNIKSTYHLEKQKQ